MPVRWLWCLALPACLVQEVDLRTTTDRSRADRCGDRQRWIHGAGCVDCIAKPDPREVCPCGWAYEPAGLPYCDDARAFYTCTACTGTIESCGAYDPPAGTSDNCFLLGTCCAQLAEDPDSIPCCREPDLVRCVRDPTAAGAPSYLVGCLSAGCCEGAPCPGGDGECEAWQTCEHGVCAPACRPGVQVCDVVASHGELVCVCNQVMAP